MLTSFDERTNEKKQHTHTQTLIFIELTTIPNELKIIIVTCVYLDDGATTIASIYSNLIEFIACLCEFISRLSLANAFPMRQRIYIFL